MTVYPLVPLGDFCEVVSGATPKTGVEEFWDGDVLWATPRDLSDLQGKYIDDTPRKLTEAGLRSCAASILPAGSVLFSSRAPIGHVAINTVPMATNQGFKSLVPDRERADASYLYHWLRSNRAHLESLGNGATFKEVSKAVVSKVAVPLPPLATQRYISQILDQVDELRAKRREGIALLDDLAQSIFLDMFGDPAGNEKRWPMKKIGDLIDSANYGTSEKASETGNLPVLQMNNITASGQVDLRDLKYMDRSSTSDKYLTRSGDVLFNRTNSPELVGKSAIYRGTDDVAFAGYLVRVRMNARNDPEYLAAFLNTRYAKRVLRSMCKSIVGMANINARELQGIDIAEPPLRLQAQFGERIRAVESMRALHRRHLAELDGLFAALQHRAFHGGLDVPAA